ncbi:MAG: TolC family protein [Gammaproteobacteria bacterium]|nr:TolC family protein [Gammaproteobacteria bacterium]MBT8109149.1 TolC family protein [Gammaproteobacteria bacterium]NNL43852.1 TolC family protein [Woeseiaceae bacterium]
MSLSAVARYRWNTGLLLCVVMLFATPVAAQQQFVVAVVGDGPADRFAEQHQKYIDELLTLTANEFDVQIRRSAGKWSRESINAVLDNAYADPEIDMVLATGFLANQIAAIRREYSKPTFLPQIIDTGLIVGDPAIGRSGVRNLNYLSAYANFAEDLDTLSRFTPYRNLILFVDAGLLSAIPALRDAALAASAERGINLNEVTHDGVDHELMNRVPAETDAVFIAGLPRMPEEAFDRLIQGINAAGLPSYSFAGVTDVERGLLVTDSEPRDVDRQARLNALNMQAVMLGDRAEKQPTESLRKERLTINMATARTIGLSPSFDLLEDAVLLNQDVEASGEQFGLVEIARLALEQNLDLQAESFGMLAGTEEIARARANLLPQIGASAGQTLRRDSPSVSAGVFAERSSDAAISLDQLLYSDAASANLKIQKELQRTRLASLDEFKLDVVQAATTSYYTVLNARSQLAVQENNFRITRANLELAQDRVRLGMSTRADVYRWQAEVARAQISVLNARAALNQSWETLNRILHKPQGERLALREATFDEPFVMSREEFDQLVQSPRDYAHFSRFYIDRALRQAPELEQLIGQIAAKRRELTSQRRAYWLPDFSVGGRYTSNLDQSGLGAGLQAGQGLDDWSVGVQATLPLFSGGLKKANVSRASFELRQLESLRASTEERVEEAIRNQLHAAQAAYQQIDLAASAAEASSKNFSLVSDAYARGTVNIIELLDAQDTSLAASAAAAESLYNFLITIVSLQRAIGGYDYLLSREDRDALAAEYRQTLTGSR